MPETIQYYGTGRRKTAVARVCLRDGSGEVTVNQKSYHQYFLSERQRGLVRHPLTLTDMLGKFDVQVTAHGGGINAQAEAVRHGITRALIAFNSDLRARLKEAGFVTRDPRAKERKKYGQKGARKRFQFSKR